MTAPPPAGLHDPLAPFRGTCGSCPARILWADTADGKRMPVNEKPTNRGNVTLTITDDRPEPRLIAGVLNRGQAAGAIAAGVRLYQSHFVDCPHAAGHRRSHSKTRRWRRPR